MRMLGHSQAQSVVKAQQCIQSRHIVVGKRRMLVKLGIDCKGGYQVDPESNVDLTHRLRAVRAYRL